MTLTIRIPVYSYVEQYLRVQYGPRIYASERNYVSTLICSMLKPFDKKDPALIRPSQKMNLGATYDIVLGESTRLGAYLSNQDVKRFSKAVDLLMRQEMYRWCHHPNATDEVIDFNIRRFLDLYGFSEDALPFENMKRWYYRERQRMNIRLNPKVDSEYQGVLHFFEEEKQKKLSPTQARTIQAAYQLKLNFSSLNNHVTWP